MTDKATILSAIKIAVKEVDPSADVILFGSQARGDNRPDSDWDVLVVTNESINKTYESALLRRLVSLQVALGIDVNYVIRSKTDWMTPTAIPLYNAIKREGLPL